MTDTLIAPRGIAPRGPSGCHTPAPACPVPTQMGWQRRLVRFGVLAVVVAALAVAAAMLPLREIADLVAALGPAAAVAIAVVGGLLLSVLVPRTAITLACGALLGAGDRRGHRAGRGRDRRGRHLLRRPLGRPGRARRQAGGRLHRLDGWLNRRGLSAVLLVRFLPLAPFGLIGYAYGTTSVCRKRYLLGTTLASIPSAVTYAVIGAAVAAAGRDEPADPGPGPDRLHPDHHDRGPLAPRRRRDRRTADHGTAARPDRIAPLRAPPPMSGPPAAVSRPTPAAGPASARPVQAEPAELSVRPRR